MNRVHNYSGMMAVVTMLIILPYENHSSKQRAL